MRNPKFGIGYIFKTKSLLFITWVVIIPAFAKGQGISSTAEFNQTLLQLKKLEESNRRVDLLAEIGAYYLNLPGEAKVDLSKADNYQKQALLLGNKIKYPKGIAESLVLKGDILRESGDKLKSEKIYQQAIDYSKFQGLKDQLAKAYSAKGQLYLNEGEDLNTKISLNKQSLQLYRSSGNKIEEANLLKNLGDYYTIKGEPAHAIKLMDSSLAIFNSLKFKALQGIYNNMSSAYTELGNYAEALKYGLLAERTAENVGDASLQRSSILNRLGLIYFYLRNDHKALESWLSAKKIALKYADPEYLQAITANVASVYIRLKRFDEGIQTLKELDEKYPPKTTQMKLRVPYLLFWTYYDTQQYDQAEPYFKTLLALHRELPDNDVNQTLLYRIIIRKLIHDRKFAEAEKYLQAHSKQAGIQGSILALSQLHRLWIDVDSGLNKPWAALKHLRIYKRLGDSIFFNEKNKQLAGLEIEFQTEQKDKDIALLSQKNQLQKVRIDSDERIRYIFIIGLLLAAIFVGLVYNRYRIKKQSNLILEQKQKEINAQNELLKKILSEKEWLLREIHHRVKNNLQIVISLLNTQSAYLDNADALVAIRNSQNRMHAMSLIHQKLYQSDNLAEIDMKWYIKELVDYMIECFGTDKKIHFSLTTETIKLDVAQAVPLGLILNEAISNAIKYAFPDDSTGEVRIGFQEMADGICKLLIADNGIGLPDGFDPDNTESLGMSLMTGLTEQLNGNINMWNKKGLTLEIAFRRHNELPDNPLGEIETINTN